MSKHLPQDPICLELHGPHDPRFRSCSGCNAYRRVREDEQTHIYSSEAMEEVIRLAESKAYDAALRDAVEAVNVTADKFSVKPGAPIMREFAAAIEALSVSADTDTNDGERRHDFSSPTNATIRGEQ